MKTIQISLPMAEASMMLKDSLRTISPSAIRAVSEIDCYGDVEIGENEATFVVGLGPTGYTTACGKITALTEKTSEISYMFKGFFWQFLVRDSIKTHIKKIYKPYMLNPT